MEATTKKKLVWISVIAIILGIIIYFIYKYTNLPKTIKAKITGSNPDINASGAFIGDYGDMINTDTVLSFGDKSNNVVRLQSEINNTITKYGYGITKLAEDGVFGLKTASALKFISNDTLKSGNVTVNKVANLPKVTSGIMTSTNYYQPYQTF